jgi:hypothetical protein
MALGSIALGVIPVGGQTQAVSDGSPAYCAALGPAPAGEVCHRWRVAARQR